MFVITCSVGGVFAARAALRFFPLAAGFRASVLVLRKKITLVSCATFLQSFRWTSGNASVADIEEVAALLGNKWLLSVYEPLLEVYQRVGRAVASTRLPGAFAVCLSVGAAWSSAPFASPGSALSPLLGKMISISTRRATTGAI